MLSDVQRERTRLDEEQRRIEAKADKLREDLSGVLVSTLEQLTTERAQDAETAEPGPSEDQAMPAVTSLDSVRKESAQQRLTSTELVLVHLDGRHEHHQLAFRCERANRRHFLRSSDRTLASSFRSIAASSRSSFR